MKGKEDRYMDMQGTPKKEIIIRRQILIFEFVKCYQFKDISEE